MKNNDKELERLQQRSYEAMIRNRELTNTLRLVQKSQASDRRPAGRTTRRPAPQHPDAPRYFSSSDTGLLLWSTREFTCLDCGRVIWGVAFVDTVLQRGGANGADAGKNIGWLSRADRPDTRCDVCGRKISG